MNPDRISKLLPAVVFAVATLLAQPATWAATTLTWDPAISGAGSDGSGTWHVGNTWWNGTADQAWADANAAAIGTNTPGNYTITLDSPVSATTVAFRTNTYELTGAKLTYSGTLSLSSGVSAVLNCSLSTPGNNFSIGGGGATLTLGGGWASTTGNPNWNGSGQAVSTINITNGTYTAGGTETYNNVTVNQTGGAVSFSIWNIGRTAAATYNLSGGTLSSPGFSVSRGFPAVFNLSNAGTVGTTAAAKLAGVTATDNAIFNVLGGNFKVGIGIGGTPGVTSASLADLSLLALGTAGTFNAASKAILNVSGGTVAAKGIVFGSSVSSYVNNPVCQFTVSGGLIYLDSDGIALGSGVTGLNTLSVLLSGGTLAATANWTASVPITLTNINGDLTVQAADVNATPFNITFSGGLSGLGGLIKTGGGILTLSGTNSYSGTTAVNNGQLTVNTLGATSIGPVNLSGGTTLSTVVSGQGQSWANAGLMLPGSVTVDFNFGAFQLSPSINVIRVNGNLTLDSSDSFTIEGSTLITGTFPLITCTGTLTLTGGVSLPTITSLPSGVVAHLEQSGKTINLVVTQSPNIFLKWGPLASGPWNFAATDWISSADSSATNYTDGIAISLNDNATSAVAISLNANVLPGNITVNNTAGGTASYSIAGPGSIGGGASVLVQGTGLLAMGATNSYSGGTTVNSGTLAINSGGTGSGPTAIGTGSLTLNPGAALDNTSGSNVVLNTPLVENWNGNFSYAGSQTNLNLGTGTVYLGNSLTVTVLSNMLTCGGSIYENAVNSQLTVQGPGALTLSGTNYYTGGTVLNSGKLNINNGGDGGGDSAIGVGRLTINAGTIDNTSGADVQFQYPVPETWSASFAFGGSGNLDLGSGALTVGTLTLTLQNGATLKTEGPMTATGSGAVATMTLAGNGTFETGGNNNNQGLSVVVGSGITYLMNKSSGASVHSVHGGLTVNSNGLAKVTGTGGQQIISTTLGPVTMGGGTLDLFGSSEKMYAITFNSGTLQNSSETPVTLTLTTNINLKGAACKFNVMTNSALTIPSLVMGTGSLLKLGEGTLYLGGTNTYTGTTTVSNGLLSFTTATLANRNYTVAGGKLEAALDPTGLALQMTMSNLTFGAGARLGFDLASGAFGDTTSSLIAAGALTMNGNVAVDVTNAPADTANDVLLTYTSRQGPGLFVAGNVPAGAYIYDNTAGGVVILTYTQPPPPAPAFASVTPVQSGGVLTGLTFAGVHGPANGTYQIMSSTNVALQPLTAWTPVQGGNFDSSGSLNVTISVNPAAPRIFYLLRVP